MKRLLAATLRVSRGGAGVSHLDGSLLSVPFPLLSQRNMYRRCEQYRMHEKHRRCVRCNSGGGDGGGGAPRPVRRPADLDTDIERVRERERGRDWEEGGREGGGEEGGKTYARAHTRPQHGSDSWERRQGRRGHRLATLLVALPFAAAAAAAAADIPERRQRERKRVTHVTRLRRSRRGIPGFETGFSDVRARARQLMLHLCLGLPDRQGRAGALEGGEDRAIWDRGRERERQSARDREEAKGGKGKEKNFFLYICSSTRE